MSFVPLEIQLAGGGEYTTINGSDVLTMGIMPIDEKEFLKLIDNKKGSN